MKKLSPLRHSIRQASAFALAVLIAISNLRGDDAPSAVAPTPAVSDTARVATDQQAVRDGATGINDNLLNVVDEMKINGLSNARITDVLQASDKLDSLNQQDMQRIIDLIKSVKALPQENDQQTALLNAYQQQRTVSSELKDLAVELTKQAKIEIVIHQLEDLTVRQSANLRDTQTLSGTGRTPAQMTPWQRRLLSRINVEQDAIKQDATLLDHALAPAPPADASSQTDASTPPAATPDSAGLETLASQAARDTSSGNLPDATINQGQLKAKLLQTLADWKAKQDLDTRLEQAKSQVDGLLKEQKDLATAAARAPHAGPALAPRQAQVEDHADLTGDIARINSDAGVQMEQAQMNMQQSAATMKSGQNTSAALPAQISTINALSNAAQLLARQTAAVEAKRNQPLTDTMKDLQNLKKDVDQAQQTARENPDQALAGKISRLQQDAAPIAPQAAARLGDAASHLQQATQSQPSPQSPQSPPDGRSAAAAKDLAAASQSVQKQMEALAKAAKDYQSLAQARDALNEAVQKATDADTSLKDAGHPDKARVSGDLTTAEGDLDQLDSTIGAQSGEAHQALQQANDEFKKGGDSSEKSDQPGASQHVETGLIPLMAAQKKIAQAMKSAQASGMAAMGMGKGSGMGSGSGNGHGPSQEMARNGDMQETTWSHEDQLHDTHGLVAPGRDLHFAGGQVIGVLSPKDRDALQQFEAEKTPPEYAPQVQQYMKNLSNSPSQ